VDAEALVRPVIEGAGLEIVDVTFGRHGGRGLLRIVVDRDGGVDLDTIAAVSERISRRLDLEGFEPGPYALEVTTPGLERTLRRPQEFRRAVGEVVRVRTGEGIVEGELAAADDRELTVLGADGERRVPLGDVASARTVVDWEAELKGSHR
jgi:ribosome maturation factor RimP